MNDEARQHILVVEEEPSIARLVARMLEDTCDVYVSRSIHAAIPHLLKRQPSAIILDFDLDRDGALHNLKVIRSICPTMPVIMLSNPASEEEVEKGQMLGVDAILPKPFSPQDVRDVVQNCIHLAAHCAIY